MKRILLVCLGNICRSPMAEAVFHAAINQHGLTHAIEVDSAALSRAHAKEKADPRAIDCAKSRGYGRIDAVRSRPITSKDFEQFDLILAMDKSVLRALERQSPKEHLGKIDLFLRFAQCEGAHEVPDPYYGNASGFTHVMELCEAGVDGILARLQNTTAHG